MYFCHTAQATRTAQKACACAERLLIEAAHALHAALTINQQAQRSVQYGTVFEATACLVHKAAHMLQLAVLPHCTKPGCHQIKVCDATV
jgi:hypothetical protein